MMKIKIYEKGLEEYPKKGAIFGSIIMLLWFALGIIACWLFHPYIAWIYFAFILIMVCIVLFACRNCYYYDKWCGFGLGKISALLFKKGDIKGFNTSIGIKITPLVYGLLMIIPIIFIIISTIQDFDIYKVVVLILLLLISFYIGGISRKKICSQCKMMLFCKGSAVKNVE